MNEFKGGRKVIERLNQHGFQAYFVGGSVRDYLLGQSIGDIDIATDATPEEVMGVFPHHVPIGLQHGTVLVVVEGESYEVTTFRVEEAYYDARHPSKVKFVRTLEDDLKRRDFTMNAIAMTKEGMMIDLFQGEHHLKQEKIETVGNANERFQEDALRIMRAFRFQSTLGFQLSNDVVKGIESAKEGLEKISVERVRTELEKMISGKNFLISYQQMVNLGIHKLLPQGIDNYNSWRELTTYPLNDLTIKEEFWTLLLIIDNGTCVDKLSEVWKLSNKEKRFIQSLLNGYNKYQKNGWSKELLYELGINLISSLQKIILILDNRSENGEIQVRLDEYNALPIKSRKEIVITGHELVGWTNKHAGPWIKEILEMIEIEIIHNRLLNEEDDIRKWVHVWQQH